MTEAAALPAEDPTALAIRTDEDRVLDMLQRRPVIDLLNARQVELVKARAAKGCSDAEVGQFLELCVTYGLDPYAQEAWCVKSPGRDGREGQLLMMVARDGLRKVARRNGQKLDGDVVRQHDAFRVTRNADRTRTIEHSYEEAGDKATDASTRGPIRGAWAEAYDERTGKQTGYFYAPLSEYRPKSENKLKFSPWGSQESVMILAAAERQALRQATPLGGLLAEGEDARVGGDEPGAPTQTLADAVAAFAPSEEAAGTITALVARARGAGHAGLSDLATVEMAVSGRSPEALEEWLWQSTQEVERAEAARAEGEDVVEAEVVEPEEDAPVPPGESPGAGEGADDEGPLDEPDGEALAKDLTDPQREALGKFHRGEAAKGGIGPQTIEALFRRGLLSDEGLTAPGRAAAEHLHGPPAETPGDPVAPPAESAPPEDPGAELERGAEAWEREAEDAEAEGNADGAASMRAEAQAMRDEAAALRDPDQSDLGL